MSDRPQCSVPALSELQAPPLSRPRSRPDWARKHFGPVNLHGWSFAKAQVQYANFQGADLRGVSFREADARGAIFDDADLTETDFTGALLQGASFRRACLHRASFQQALLLSAHLEHAGVQGATFAGANLEWAWVAGVDFCAAVVSCAVFLNVRGLAEEARRVLETQGGFTGCRPMRLGRELYETPLPHETGAATPMEG